jgi:predicted nucleotidyltransferase
MEVNRLLKQLRRELISLYGPRLRDLRLFGSYARNEQRSDSDLDVVMMLDDFDQAWSEIQRTGAIVARLSLEFEVSLSLIPMRERAWREGASLLARQISREGVVIQ